MFLHIPLYMYINYYKTLPAIQLKTTRYLDAESESCLFLIIFSFQDMSF